MFNLYVLKNLKVMSLLEITPKNSFKSDDHAEKLINCQLLFVHFFYGNDSTLFLRTLEHEIEAVLTETGAGEYHGSEISPDLGEGYLMIIGEDANKLYTAIKPLLEKSFFMDRSIVTLRTGHFGNPRATEQDFMIRFSKLSQN